MSILYFLTETEAFFKYIYKPRDITSVFSNRDFKVRGKD